MSWFGKGDAEFSADIPKETVRQLEQNSGSITGVRFASARAAMVEVYQSRESMA
jgi:hypothetical protein